MNEKDRMSKARSNLVLDSALFGTLALHLEMVETKDGLWRGIPIPALGTDGRKLIFNPEWTEKQSNAQLQGGICHEVAHCMLSHFARIGGRDKGVWNKAGDYKCNEIVIDSGFQLWDSPEPLVDSQYNDMSTEDVYDKIYQEAQDSSGSGKGQGPEQPGQVLPSDGQDGESADELKEQWKQRTVQAAQAARAAGKLPGALEEFIDALINPKIPWQSVLQEFVQSSAKNDLTWARPNRRFISQGIYLPALRSNEIDGLVCAFDTSGSVSQEEMIEISSELNAILEMFRTQLDVLYCDTEIQDHIELTFDDCPIRLEVKGGGGTDFCPPFGFVIDNGLTPTCLLYFTDGYCSSFPDAPDYPVLWVITSGGVDEFEPPFGKVVRM